MNAPLLKSPRGRAVAYALYFGVAGYFIVAMVGSVVTEIYGSPPPANVSNAARAERTWCTRALVDLRDELEGKVALELQRPNDTGAPLARWQGTNDKWQEHFQAARSRCVGIGNVALDQGYASLLELHLGYAQVVTEVSAARHGPAARLSDAIGNLKKQH